MVTDERGFGLARYAMASVLKSQTYEYDLYLFVNGWKGPTSSDGIVKLARDCGHPLKVVSLENNRFSQLKTRAHITSAAFLKLDAASEIIDSYDRVLYVDTDMLFFENLPIGDIDLGSNPVGAVHDVAESNAITDAAFFERSSENGLSPHYFNSGMMLFNSSKIDIDSTYKRYIRECDLHQNRCLYKTQCKCLDQCAFNIAFEDKWMPLPLEWNMQSSMLHTPDWRNASLRHYTGPQKFLPPAPRRSDKKEYDYIHSLAKALGDDSLARPFGAQAIYLLNGVRRFRDRKRMQTAIKKTRGLLPQVQSARLA